MGRFTLQNVRMFAGGADLTTVSNKVELNAEAEEKDATAFAAAGAAWKEVLAGIRTTSISASGQWEAGDLSKVDDAAFAALGTQAGVSVCPAGAADGSLAWLSAYLRQNYTLGGSIGDVAPWNGTFQGSWPLVRGTVLATSTARTATGTGSAFQLGAVPAGKSLYAAVHVMSVAGTTPSLTVKVQADNAVGMPSPVDALTFTAQNAIGGQILRAAGPLTDDWFRATWTITGTGPSFLFAVTAGIA
jgi:hypothetical protein